MKYNWDINKIKKIVPQCINLKEVLEHLEIPRQGNNSSTLKRILDQNQIDYSHFTGRARNYSKPNLIQLEEYLNENETRINSFELKNKLIKAGYKENKCEICGISEWQGKPINCQLHHINGNSTDNRIENLQILCPNCHSQTDNYCGASIKKYEKHCPDCGKVINKKSKYCSRCTHNHKNDYKKTISDKNEIKIVSKKPSKEELVNCIRNLKSWTNIGKYYDVTDSSVRKWATSYGIPNKIKEAIIFIENI